ncbi:hypothetical protein G647_03862 [Cladophialophora carrionii CBS 160.54]|uniref:Fungal N-terminal domain-containing protein n=1 Tax=Cladophialophora carrionii CBS 160.54 TaxID=1279043 RepID=V9DDU6_9EURO|nr:uncharacterized protein G647_03862 [Cladophialophora carrionii CBS 160.54]ETI24493.1 hypothetical protein G647_03862 [Cladophialophora carrionii CBS 160.54]
MDPLTITTGCISLLSGLTALSKQITTFALVAHEARADMNAFSKEIASLTLCLDALRQPDLIRFYPDALRPNLTTIIRECDGVVVKMSVLLSKLSSASVARRMQWSFAVRDEADRLRQSLEAHKSALQIAVSLVSLSATQSLQNDTSSIRVKAALLPGLKEDTAQIAELRAELAALRMDMNLYRTGLSIPMQRFLEESTAYADSVCDIAPPFRETPVQESMPPPLTDGLGHADSTQQISGRVPRNMDQANKTLPEHMLCQDHHHGNASDRTTIYSCPNKPRLGSRTSLATDSESSEDLLVRNIAAKSDRSDGLATAADGTGSEPKPMQRSSPTPESVLSRDRKDDDFVVTRNIGTENAVSQGRSGLDPVGLRPFVSCLVPPSCREKDGDLEWNADIAMEVDDQPSQTLELQLWASKLHAAVSLARVEPVGFFGTVFKTGRAVTKKDVTGAQVEASKTLRDRRSLGLSDAELLQVLILSDSQSFATCEFSVARSLAAESFEGMAVQGTRILQTAIRMYQFDVVDLLIRRMCTSRQAAAQALITAVRCGASRVIRRLLELRVPLPPITTQDVWLGSCYGMWLFYSLASHSSFCSTGSNTEFRLQLYDTLCPQTMIVGLPSVLSRRLLSSMSQMANTSKWYYGFIYDFSSEYQLVRKLHENSLRQLVGLDQLPWETRRGEGPSHAAACAQYLEYKIEAYAKQPWSSYEHYW